jgi:hypothetical protein
MLLPDAIRPYLALIRVALWCLLAGGLFVTGCRHGQETQRDANAKALASAERDAANNLAAANACGQALSDISASTREAEQRAQEWRAAANAADAWAGKSAQERDASVAAATRALEKARATPSCAAQLEIELCPDIPLL